MIATILAGAAFGTGIVMFIAALRPAAPDLRAAVANLTEPNPARPGRIRDQGEQTPVGRFWSQLTTDVADRVGLARYSSDLQLLGISPSRMATEKLGYLALGLAFPMLLSIGMGLIGLELPFMIPALASLVLAGGMFFIPDIDLRVKATQARRAMRRTICLYLELVAMERAADAGAVESLERAAAIGQGPGFEHISEALLRARVEGRTPWGQIDDLAQSLRVPELGDVADIMRLSGEDGAAVLPTLRARAASLRTAILQADIAAANEASERMSIPVALLAIAMLGLLGYPAFSQIIFG